MIRLRHKLLIQLLRGMDQMILFLTFALAIFLSPQPIGIVVRGEPRFMFWDAFGLPLLGLGWLTIFHVCIQYRADRFQGLASQLADVLKATTLATFWLLVISGVFSIQRMATLHLVFFWGITTGYAILSRVFMRALLAFARRSGHNLRYLLFVGTNEESRDMAKKIDANPALGLRIVGYVAENAEARAIWEAHNLRSEPLLGELGDLKEILAAVRVDEIMVCLPVESRFQDIGQIIRNAKDLGIVIRLVPHLDDADILRNVHIEELGGRPVFTLFREQMVVQLMFKRMIDIIVSSAALIVSSPLLVLVAILVKLSSPGPVFFVQERVGTNKRRFNLYKFRSMVVNAEALKGELAHLNERDGPVFKIENDPRITPVGRILRKTSIDEMPQLLNVLKGEMSLVGPRPPTPDEVDQYKWQYRKRLSVKPGITCLWQISGRKGISFQQWMEMDQQYIENWSVWLDFEILFRTIPVVLLGRGAS